MFSIIATMLKTTQENIQTWISRNIAERHMYDLFAQYGESALHFSDEDLANFERSWGISAKKWRKKINRELGRRAL